MNISLFGERFGCGCGVAELMQDVGELIARFPDALLLGIGNPAVIPELKDLYRRCAADFFARSTEFDRALACYDDPQGEPKFLKAFATLFRERFGLPITEANVTEASGTQQALFCLLNIIAGEMPDGSHRKILIPASPDYVGYADIGVDPSMFVAAPAKIVYPPDLSAPAPLTMFRYEVDFDAVERVVAQNDVAAILISRPSNPSGCLMKRSDLTRLAQIAERIGAWLIIDSAYGGPFPGIVEDEAELDSVFWTPQTILTYSFSKIGLPGARVGVVVAPEEIIRMLSTASAVVGLAHSGLGQRIARPLFETGEILRVSREIVRPFYCKRRAEAVAVLAEECKRAGANVRIHSPEGTFFLWLWAPDLTISSRRLNDDLKEHKVATITGDTFFFGLSDAEKEMRDPV
ncbi:MAG: aminotransferase class I/II-fold pyridoxal phosphate-dependent enzyme, partial [Thermoguttaceae bacterium]|nr:aminotransferase class I/II-fold pyridoxal phosphate-dependent enzyme [Thermoguttaceae bacterium]